jgi:hypothetical protein
MLEKKEEISKIIYTVSQLLNADGKSALSSMINNSEINIEELDMITGMGGLFSLRSILM